MDISIVVPVYNEDESIRELVEWINRVTLANSYTCEIIMIDDGSTDQSWKVIEELQKQYPVRGIKFRRNYGKAAALYCGFEAAQGNVVITMDADLQDSPDEIPGLYKMIVDDKFDMVSGWKKKRYDPISKTLPSKLYNKTVRIVSGIKIHDMNCGLKAYHQKVVKSIEVFGDMHRFIPVLAKQAGYKNIGEKVVEHRKRQYGYSKYGMKRLVTGFLDLLTIMFISKFGKSPMHLFGTLGVISFMAGFGILGYFAVGKMFFHLYGMTQRPLFFFGVLALIFGTQLFLTGFLAELVTRNSSDRNNYLIEKQI